MRLLAMAGLIALLAVPVASAQEPEAAPDRTESGGPEETIPLMTAPRPDDRPTTDPVPLRPGLDGAAPSEEPMSEKIGEPVDATPPPPEDGDREPE